MKCDFHRNWGSRKSKDMEAWIGSFQNCDFHIPKGRMESDKLEKKNEQCPKAGIRQIIKNWTMSKCFCFDFDTLSYARSMKFL